ncbi:hypothetical protein GCM10023210_27000 [Chryseobacterium ginsengisoli]|uniref:Lipoprotein n=2 Tax=Chryseobacterium ginsengisoli TaxID=363853 RepID=A0ABP9MGY0_9FLAO
MLTTISCHSQEYENDIINLESFSFKLDPEKFYKESMKRENIKFTSGKQYVEKDTLRESDFDWKGDKNKILGIQYNVKSYSPKDVVAKFNNIKFRTMEFMVNKEKDLMLVNAVAKVNEKEIKNLISDLNKKFGTEPEIVDEEMGGFIKYTIYSWKNNNQIIKLATALKLDFSNPHNIVSEKDKKFIQDVEKDNIEESVLFICNPKYESELKGKLYSGNWIKFK